ncbi:MAG: hypothetical protein NC242_10345 [Roseburia sp.]|nr:hypothetical protein [Roseburia sp.]MCM1431883.1 hypothetical protein [Muribaculaceae bacterium]
MDEKSWTEGASLVTGRIRIPGEKRKRIRRGRLLKCFRTGEAFVVLYAGAGFGKTTAMAEYADSHREQCCWLTLCEADNDFTQFLYAMAASISYAMQEAVFFDIPAPGKAVAAGQGSAESGERFLARFFSILPEGGLHICLDNFQVITNERIFDFLLRLCECGAGRVRVLLAVRGGFPKFLNVGILQGVVRKIGAGELRLDSAETGLLLSQLAGNALPEHVKERVQEYTCGWAAAVVFAGLELQAGETAVSFGRAHLRGVDAFLFDRTHLHGYIFYEIYRKLACDTQIFMQDSSVFSVIEPAVCGYATGRRDAENMLEYLVREQLFLSRLPGERRYCYHPAFLEFLQSRVEQERRERILQRASEYRAARDGSAQAEAAAAGAGNSPLLSVACLGGLSVRGEAGEILWRTKKTKELFACLFHEEGRGVGRDILMERLWPEKPPEKAAILFHTTVSYLRRALLQAGASSVLVVKNQCYSLHMQEVASDLQRLRMWEKLARTGGEPQERGEALLCLYRRGYMYGEDYLWLEGYPEQVEREYVALLELLAKREVKRGAYGEAAEYLKRASQLDCYNVPLAERLMECLIACRDIAGARRRYERLKESCEEELGQRLLHSFEYYMQNITDRT